ncbi:MAG: cupin domain-containing protein [Cyanobacteria bacterium J06560_2]
MVIRIANVFEGLHHSSIPSDEGLKAHFPLNSDTESSVQVRAWHNDELALPAEGTHFGFVWRGMAYVMRDRSLATFPLSEGMYFSASEAVTLSGHDTSGIVITDLRHQGRFQIGGPLELEGRFAYIDGGMTSLLIAPMAFGDPVLNALYMPPNVDQTVHCHPSDRIGIIIKGTGECCERDECRSLTPGTLFHIPAHQEHKFVTYGQGLDLVVFHPDSDMGFSDRNHPMLSRTLVNNVRATDLPDIQTSR